MELRGTRTRSQAEARGLATSVLARRFRTEQSSLRLRAQAGRAQSAAQAAVQRTCMRSPAPVAERSSPSKAVGSFPGARLTCTSGTALQPSSTARLCPGPLHALRCLSSGCTWRPSSNLAVSLAAPCHKQTWQVRLVQTPAEQYSLVMVSRLRLLYTRRHAILNRRIRRPEQPALGRPFTGQGSPAIHARALHLRA